MKRNSILILMLATIFALTGCGNANAGDNASSEPAQVLPYQGETLMVHSGAGLSKAMDEIGQAFEKEYGATVNFNYAGCGQLLGQMEINKTGDIFVGASQNDMEIAQEKGFADQYVEIAYHIPAIGVPKGNPAQITCLTDLAKPGIKLILGDEETNAIGKKGATIFAKNHMEAEIAANVIARDATVNEIVTHLSMKQGDAGLIWEDNGVEAKDIEIIAIPEEQNVIDKASVCILNFSANQELAQAFIDFTSSEDGKAILVKHGFKTI